MNKRKIIVVLMMAVALGIAGMLIYYLEMQNAGTETTSGIVDDGNKENVDEIMFEGKKYRYDYGLRNVLFLGIDNEEPFEKKEAGQGGQSDTILLFCMNPSKKTIQMIEIPRDTMTKIKVYDKEGDFLAEDTAQIALQYAYGDGEERSCRLMEEAVSYLMYDIPINAYVALNMDGIEEIVDGIGGVEVDGKLLNGKEAQNFVQARDKEATGSNLERMKNQKAFILAFFEKLKDSGAEDKSIYKTLFDTAKDQLITNISTKETEKFAEYELLEESQVIPGEMKAGEDHDEFYTDNKELQKIIINMFYKVVEM